MARIIRAYFEERSLGYSLKFLDEKKPLGTAGSLKMLRGKLRKNFFLSNCDTIIKTDYVELYSFHEKNDYDITVVASVKQFKVPYGVCQLNSTGSLDVIKEKPEYHHLVMTGLYVINPKVIDLIPENSLFHMTHLIEKVKENGGRVGVYPISEKAWIDVGQWSEYQKALKVNDSL
jgi:NDP-sugar pyrophosphorylase family protein